MIYEYTCRQCGTPNETPQPVAPLYCYVCGHPDLKRVWGGSFVWPKDQRGH